MLLCTTRYIHAKHINIPPNESINAIANKTSQIRPPYSNAMPKHWLCRARYVHQTPFHMPENVTLSSAHIHPKRLATIYIATNQIIPLLGSEVSLRGSARLIQVCRVNAQLLRRIVQLIHRVRRLWCIADDELLEAHCVLLVLWYVCVQERLVLLWRVEVGLSFVSRCGVSFYFLQNFAQRANRFRPLELLVLDFEIHRDVVHQVPVSLEIFCQSVALAIPLFG